MIYFEVSSQTSVLCHIGNEPVPSPQSSIVESPSRVGWGSTVVELLEQAFILSFLGSRNCFLNCRHL
jgi:hypothetical protein